jgi:hypothetical protein
MVKPPNFYSLIPTISDFLILSVMVISFVFLNNLSWCLVIYLAYSQFQTCSDSFLIHFITLPQMTWSFWAMFKYFYSFYTDGAEYWCRSVFVPPVMFSVKYIVFSQFLATLNLCLSSECHCYRWVKKRKSHSTELSYDSNLEAGFITERNV